MSILSIFDYIWVEIAYSIEKIVLLPRTWSVRFFAQKTNFLVASIVTLGIIEGNWSRFVRLTLIKKIGSVFMEIFERKVSLKLSF